MIKILLAAMLVLAACDIGPKAVRQKADNLVDVQCHTYLVRSPDYRGFSGQLFTVIECEYPNGATCLHEPKGMSCKWN